MEKFFPSKEAFHDWLAKNHKKEEELVLCYYKKATKKPSITWEESVDVAVAFGWIDGIRRKVDEEAFSVRFTPRRPNSIWSNRNIAIAEELISQNKMSPSGLESYNLRKEDKTGIYSFEQEAVSFLCWQEKQFKENKEAWGNYKALPNYYKTTVTHWASSAKREETQKRRLEQLIESCQKNERLKQFTSKK